MDSQFHLMMESLEHNLVPDMRQFNGVYIQAYTSRHEKVGRPFQGGEGDLNDHLELCRNILLNPVREAGNLLLAHRHMAVFALLAGIECRQAFFVADMPFDLRKEPRFMRDAIPFLE